MPDRKRYIAIVDDHAMFRKGLAALINLFPTYEVMFDASNGKDFIKQLNPKKPPDIVLMDIHMPQMDGYETANWVSRNYKDIKVLALSTMDAEGSIIKMIKSGAKGYVLKDAEPAELKLAFDEVINRGFFYNELITRKVMGAVKDLGETRNNVPFFSILNDRDIEFLKLTCTELNYKEIGDKMNVSARTVEGYRDVLCEKLGLKTRVGLCLYAIKNNIVQL